MVSRKLRKKILKTYFSLKFPGSFQGISTFRESLKDNLGIHIGHSALRRILKSSLPYQVNVTKSRKFKTRANYSRGVYIECYADPIFIPINKVKKNKQEKAKQKNFLALVVVDVHSRMLYSTKLARINPECLKRAFGRLFKKGMP